MTWQDGMFSGCLPRDDRLGEHLPVFERSPIGQIIPRNEWRSRIADRPPMRPLVGQIMEQRYGSCASHATTMAFEVCWNLAYGKEDWFGFSPNSLYPHVSDRPNQGSTITGNAKQLQTVGLLPRPGQKAQQLMQDAGIPVNTREENDYYGTFPSGWKETAKHFIAPEAFDIGTYEGLITALLIGCPCVVGRRGHAICHLDPQDDGTSVEYANSWSPQWGDEGFGIDTESMVSSAIRSYGAVAYRTVFMNDKFLELMRN